MPKKTKVTKLALTEREATSNHKNRQAFPQRVRRHSHHNIFLKESAEKCSNGSKKAAELAA